MVARVRTGKSILGALNYNESKVKKGDAECIAANMFGREPDEIVFGEKLKRFHDQMRLNRRSKTKVLHISLNFSPQDKLDNERLKEIADAYMEIIGFGNQPFLVYRHFDAAHTHVHILATSIQDNGKRIPLHNIGRNQSEKARQEIENQFDLVKAKGRQLVGDRLDPRQLKKALYGEVETKLAISNIVRTVTRAYKYTSVAELNAVLLQYNLVADRGKEDTRMFQNKGLLYSLLDEKGNKIGVPIKASRIYGKPTLSNLEKQFKLNEALRKPLKTGLQDKIDFVFSKNGNPKLVDFVRALEAANIKTVFRQNDEGRVYGITFVDNQNRVVFNGSDLGKQYGANAIMERLTEIPKTGSINQVTLAQKTFDSGNVTTARDKSSSSFVEQAIRDLTTTDNAFQGVDPALTRKRRKKRRRSL
jgi:hypothetical protein